MTNLKISTLVVIALLSASVALLTGCETSGAAAAGLSSAGKPENVFLATNKLPADVKRVAILPLACDAKRADLAAGREELQSVLVAELIKTKKFEVVEISPEEMERLTGQPGWTGAEILPADFLDALNKACGCDAVMFCELTEFRPYPPLAVGWRLKLVDVRNKETIWAGDEIFVSPQFIAHNAQWADDLGLTTDYGSDAENARWLAANSPRQFGENSVASLLNTLPAR